MSLLLPLGLLGLISLLVLLLIYILKPNYQQKMISSTFVWKLSLKYKKKRIPISRLRNILLIICQCLILTGLSFVLSNPVILGEKLDATEEVLIIDASGSMLVELDGETRFERAVAQVETRIVELFEDGGVVSVIVADTEPYFIAQRANSEDSVAVFEKLADLTDGEELACSYDSANMEESVKMAQNVVMENPKASVYLYTGTTYIDTNNISIVPIDDEDEWNVAVLDCSVEMIDNYYDLTVNVGCYNRSEAVTVYCEVYGFNKDYSTTEIFESDELFFSAAEEEQKVTFTFEMLNGKNELVRSLHTFDYLRVYVEEADNFAEDNTYYVYGGIKEEVKVQYASTFRNNFFRSSMYAIRAGLGNVWDIDFDEVDVDLQRDEKPAYAVEEYDIYIFEHFVPEILPTDGIVLLVDPNGAPKNSGLRIDSMPINWAGMGFDYAYRVEPGDPHPLTEGIDASSIFLTEYNKVISHDGYDELWHFNGDPILLAKNTDEVKVAVLAMDLNFSTLAMTEAFPTLMYNLFQYFMPATITDFTYEVGDSVTLRARGEELLVSGGNLDLTVTEFPHTVVVDKPGSYTLSQFDFAGEYIIENFFVGMPKTESNITKEIDALPLLYVEEIIEQEDKDLLVYFAAVIVALMFLEWWLQSREYF